METDKVNLEVHSPIDGILSEIKIKEGETVEVGALLGIISDGEKQESKALDDKKKVEKNTNVVSFEKNKISEPKIFEEKKFEDPLVLTEEPLILTETVQKNRQKSLNEIAKMRNKARGELLKTLNPILKKYMEDNNIRLVLDKKTVLLGDNKLDITDQIIKLLNKELKSLSIK